MRKLFVLLSTILIVLIALAPLVGCQQDSEPPPEDSESPPPQDSEPPDSQEPEPNPPPEVTYTLDVTVDPSGSGNVSLSPIGGTYDAGTEATITALAHEGYIFDHWNGDATGTSNPINITMDSNKSVTANFTIHLEDGIILQNNFDEDSGDWLGTVKDGALHIGESAPEGSTYARAIYNWPPAAQYYPDFGYEVEITTIEGDPSVPRGIIFLCTNSKEASKNTRYVFAISANGSYTLLIGEEEYRYIINWTASSYINRGNATNLLKVICQNSIIELYVNGHLLKSVSGEFPDDIGNNGIGLFIVASNGDTILAIDNIKMWAVTQ